MGYLIPMTRGAKKHMDKIDGKKDNSLLILILLFIASAVSIYIFNSYKP